MGRRMVKKALVALTVVLVLQSLFALCLVSAMQLLVLRDAPFGVTGASPVVNAVTSKVDLRTLSYADESAVMEAINQSKLYGAYLPGTTSDTLIVVPAKSFFGRVELEAAFEDAARKLGRSLTVRTVKPLPTYDRLGGVCGLLLVPLLVGGCSARARRRPRSRRSPFAEPAHPGPKRLLLVGGHPGARFLEVVDQRVEQAEGVEGVAFRRELRRGVGGRVYGASPGRGARSTSTRSPRPTRGLGSGGGGAGREVCRPGRYSEAHVPARRAIRSRQTVGIHEWKESPC
ncbi:hypothetical protein [Embleya sp. NPDC050493]|uniref:hypothetical protein n=1 Tax=Embleya sp. NPDC050493 TaxID=3363989 RepID=UPI0037933C4E